MLHPKEHQRVDDYSYHRVWVNIELSETHLPPTAVHPADCALPHT